MIFLDKIPSAIKSKVQDKDWSLTFKFEEMPCNHKIDAKDFEKVNCDKCSFDERETWLETILQNTNPMETIKNKDGNNITLTKITVNRGKYDDCIGITREYI